MDTIFEEFHKLESVVNKHLGRLNQEELAEVTIAEEEIKESIKKMKSVRGKKLE